MYFLIVLTIIILIIMYILLNVKKRNLILNFLLCLGLYPYVFIFLVAIISFFQGSGLVGDTGGFSSAMFVIVICLLNFWYIYLPALLLIILSLYIKQQKNKTTQQK